MKPLQLHGQGARSVKVRVAANFAGVPIEHFKLVIGVTNKSPEYLAKCPTGKYPYLETPDGPLFESNAICRYIANLTKSSIHPRDNGTRAEVDAWVDYSMSLDDIPSQLIYPLLGLPYDKEKADACWRKLDEQCDVLNKHLAARTYFVGEHVTLADIVMLAQLFGLWLVAFGEERRKSFPNLIRWMQMMLEHPQTLKVLCTPLQPPKEDVKYQEGAANLWGDGPFPFEQVLHLQ
eukprot:jgi/Botrbrau1/3411/Bobra.0337s0044.1